MAHAYWRLNTTNANAAFAPCIAQWIFKDGGGTIIPTTGGTASASGAFAGNVAANAFDGSGADYWCPNNPTSSWLQYHFASPISPVSFQVQTGPNDGNQFNGPMDFNIQFSDDGISWTTLVSYKGVSWNGVNWTNTFTATNVEPVTPTITWRLFITAIGGGAPTQLASLTLKDTLGNPISTNAFAASASAVTSVAPNQPYNAFDGNSSTDWQGGGAPQWIQYDFASLVQVASFCITSSVNLNSAGAPTAMQLQYSYDRTSWFTAGTFTASGWVGGQTKCFTLTTPLPPSQSQIFAVIF